MSETKSIEGKRYRFQKQEFWACNGLIYLENRDTGDFKAISRADAAARAIMFNDELRRDDGFYPDERTELSNCICNLCEAVKEAKHQGDPFDPEAAKQRAKESHNPSVLIGTDGDAYLQPVIKNPSWLLGAGVGRPLSGSKHFAKLRI